MSGWIRVNRGIFKHPFFQKEPMSEREALIWMIAKAAWQDTHHRVGGKMVEVPRGSFMTTLRELQSEWMWGSDSRVRNFLNRLEAERTVERTTCGPRNAPKTHVTICNYDDYQATERTKNAPKTHRERTAERSKRTKINNKQDIPPVSPAEILAEICSLEMAESFVAHRKEMKKPVTERAAQMLVEKIKGHPDPDAVLRESIANGWQGVFPEKVKPQFSAIQGGQHGQPHNTDHESAFARAARLRRMASGSD